MNKTLINRILTKIIKEEAILFCTLADEFQLDLCELSKIVEKLVNRNLITYRYGSSKGHYLMCTKKGEEYIENN